MVERIEALPGALEGEIELARVERELAALWAAAPEDRGAEPTVLRACALNLLILGASPAELERARPIAARTTLAHPSRVVLLAPVPDAAVSGVGARISAFCHRLGGGSRHVCCEEITVLARGAAAERLRSAALPLLLPDLPVHLWVLDDMQDATGTDRQRLAAGAQRLAELADEVIWSARMPDEQLPATPARARPPAVVDLDWMRIQPWRELTAQLFDAPDHRPLLDRLEAVEFVVADPPVDRPGAGWLWMGWLASQLGWDRGGEMLGAVGRGLRGPAGAVSVQATSVAAAGVTAGELTAVRLHARGGAEPIKLERLPAPDPTDLWICEAGSRRVHFGRRDEATLLGEALDGASRDRIYQAAWETALRLWKDSG